MMKMKSETGNVVTRGGRVERSHVKCRTCRTCAEGECGKGRMGMVISEDISILYHRWF